MRKTVEWNYKELTQGESEIVGYYETRRTLTLKLTVYHISDFVCHTLPRVPLHCGHHLSSPKPPSHREE